MALRYIFLFAIFACPSIYSIPPADTMTGVFDERIKSLRIHALDDDFGLPVTVLGTGSQILVEFDHLAEEREYFRYSLTHCNAFWQPSGLVESEFLDGFNEGTIEDFEYSQATTVHYVHYTLAIPNQDIYPKVSGNYLLKIYPEHEPDSIFLQCRFMVSEQTAPVQAEVTTNTDYGLNSRYQQLAITVDTERADVDDKFNDLLVVIGQNGRLDSEQLLRQPLRLQGSKLVYEHQPNLIFDAGNEYRRMEIINDQYPTMGVDHIELHPPYYHYVLYTDTPRNKEIYNYDQTQHGRYFIRQYNSQNSDTEADYGVAHFTLDYQGAPGDMVFLDGDFTQRRFDPNSRMVYNPSTGLYERSMLLKQGAYNYQYLVVPQGGKRGYTAQIEGDKYQTENEYFIRVYHRRPGDRYDRLIGVAAIQSRP